MRDPLNTLGICFYRYAKSGEPERTNLVAQQFQAVK